MIKKTLFAILVMLSSQSAFANGYWDERQVCDYETVTVSTPYTACSYNGFLYSGIKQIYSYGQTLSFSGHVSCPFSTFGHEWRHAYNPQTQQWENDYYTGTLYLSSTQHLTSTSTTTQVVEGSCRIERVWVPICRRCQIP
ncbi:MAG: hypothetical protein ACJAYF_000405 [Arenicella sp.]|jgi:hypothetical protein